MIYFFIWKGITLEEFNNNGQCSPVCFASLEELCSAETTIQDYSCSDDNSDFLCLSADCVTNPSAWCKCPFTYYLEVFQHSFSCKSKPRLYTLLFSKYVISDKKNYGWCNQTNWKHQRQVQEPIRKLSVILTRDILFNLFIFLKVVSASQQRLVWGEYSQTNFVIFTDVQSKKCLIIPKSP